MISLRQPVEYSSTATKKCINSVFRGCRRKKVWIKHWTRQNRAQSSPKDRAGQDLWVTAYAKVTRHPGSNLSPLPH